MEARGAQRGVGSLPASSRTAGHAGFSNAGDGGTGIPRSSFIQVPLAVQSDQLARGRKVFEQLASFAKDKSQVEEKAAHAVLRASLLGAVDHEVNGGSLQRALLALRRFCSTSSRQHSVFARQIQEQVHQPLEQVKSRHAEFVMGAKLGVQRSVQLVQEAESKLGKAKRQLARAQHDEQGQRDALARARQDPRASQKDIDWAAGRAGRAMETSRLAEANAMHERYLLLQAFRARDDAIAGAARHFEIAERERASSVARAITTFAAKQGEFYATQIQHLEALTQAVEALDPDGDVDSFIERRRQPEHASLYGVALCLLDWARTDLEDAAKSKSQQRRHHHRHNHHNNNHHHRQQQHQRHDQQQENDGGAGGVPRVNAMTVENVAEDGTRGSHQNIVHVRDQAQGKAAAADIITVVGLPTATVVHGDDTATTTSGAAFGSDPGDVPAAGVVETIDSEDRPDDDRRSVAHETIALRAKATDRAGTCARSAIERHLRNLIPDQQQSSKTNKPVTTASPGMGSGRPQPSTERTPTQGSRNPFDADFVGAEWTSGAAAGLVADPSPDENYREDMPTVAPSVGNGADVDVDSGGMEASSGARECAAEEARRELKELVRSEKGRGHFLQALNERRSEATEVTPEAFEVLVETLRVFLDACEPEMPEARPLSPSGDPVSPVGAFVGPEGRTVYSNEETNKDAFIGRDDADPGVWRSRTLSAPSRPPGVSPSSPSARNPMMSTASSTALQTPASRVSAPHRLQNPVNIPLPGSSPPPNPAPLRSSHANEEHHLSSTPAKHPPTPRTRATHERTQNTPHLSAPTQSSFSASSPASSSNRPQAVNLLELAASVVGIRNHGDDVFGGGVGGGSAGFNGPDGGDGPLVTGSKRTGTNGAATAGSGGGIRGGAVGSGSGGGGGGASAGGMELQRGYRWGFGGSRESAGNLLFGMMEGHINMMEAVEAALGNGKRMGGRGAGASGKSGMITGVDASRCGEGDMMDIRSARQAMILANTFYKADEVETCGDLGGSGAGGSRPARRYLLKDLRDHALWKHPRFWDEALMLGVKEQLQEGPATVRWDDLQGEARREAVARTHNIVFSQLASIAFNMLECGVDGARVRTEVARKCKESQLGEAQVQELLRDLDNRIRRPSLKVGESDLGNTTSAPARNSSEPDTLPPLTPLDSNTPAIKSGVAASSVGDIVAAVDGTGIRSPPSPLPPPPHATEQGFSPTISPELAFVMEARARAQSQSRFDSQYFTPGVGSVVDLGGVGVAVPVGPFPVPAATGRRHSSASVSFTGTRAVLQVAVKGEGEEHDGVAGDGEDRTGLTGDEEFDML